MAAMSERELYGYLIPNGCTKFFCSNCSYLMSATQQAKAIPVYSVKDAPIGTLCTVCAEYLEDFGELDEDDPFWDDDEGTPDDDEDDE